MIVKGCLGIVYGPWAEGRADVDAFLKQRGVWQTRRETQDSCNALQEFKKMRENSGTM